MTTIAGALALFSIPVAQYPDIVPPQVQVTTLYIRAQTVEWRIPPSRAAY
ncbi:MAG: efflux RND transporter permease subunit [Rhodopseudomonas palustris]|nr:efflux RND transporter permease subunit [Rhodopseudomonas palustris]